MSTAAVDTAGRFLPTTAPYRRNPEGVLHAEMLPSACADPELSADARRDPFWDRLWAPGSQALWSTAAMARTRAAEAGSRVPRRMLRDEKAALEKLVTGRGWKDRLGCWAVLDEWRTATAEQMAAITGSRYFLNPEYSAITNSFSLGILDIGAFSQPLAAGSSRDAVYRPGDSKAFDELIRPRLTWTENLSVTGGGEWNNRGLHDRHNILATELALRAAEYLPLGTVLGEKYATVDLLAGAGLGKDLPTTYNRRADGVIVREDGLRIALELTASTGAAFKNKVRRWAELIAERPLETSGLVVLFVAAPHPDRTRAGKDDPRSAIYRALSQVLASFPGTGADSPAARIGIASWEEWFPGRHLMSESFFGLRADFALNDAKGAQKWVSRELLGDVGFEPWHTFDAKAVIENAKLLAATPHWLRRGDHTYLVGSPSSRVGIEPIHKSPARPEKIKGRALGEAVGAAGPAKLPDRLRIEY